LERPDDSRWLPILRPAALLLIVALLLAWAAGAVLFVRGLTTNLDGILAATFFDSPYWLPAYVRRAAAELGLGPAAPSLFWLLAIELPMVATFGGLGLLIFFRLRNRLGVALGVSFVLIGTSITGPVIGMVETVLPGGDLVGGVLETAGLVAFVSLFFYFPNGRFVPTWSKWLLLLFIVPSYLAITLRDPSTLLPAAESATIGIIAIAGGAQVYRYLRVSTPVEKVQTRWAMAALLAFVSLVTLQRLFIPHVFDPPGPPSGGDLAAYLAFYALQAVFTMLFAAAVTTAILRYRLYDIDLIISRTLLYGGLTAGLALVYFASVVLLQSLLPAGSPLVTVLSTLAVAALFAPLRRRLQTAIDRRFHRRKYDARATLEAFAAGARNEVDLERLLERIAATVETTMQPEHVSVWLRPADEAARDR
jgi:hypothetical protein